MKHKHYDAIVAWANGADIEWSFTTHENWMLVDRPTWDENLRYRVKKEPVIEVKYFQFNDECVNSNLDNIITYDEFTPDLERWHLKITYQDGIAIKAELPCAK